MSDGDSIHTVAVAERGKNLLLKIRELPGIESDETEDERDRC